MLKPGVDVAVPVLQKAGSKALEVASPAVSGVVKQAQESLQSAGVDPAPVVSAAKVLMLPTFDLLNLLCGSV